MKINTNGVTIRDYVAEDELNNSQLIPVIDFLEATVLWLKEQSLLNIEDGSNLIC